jgi:hypothetical protein
MAKTYTAAGTVVAGEVYTAAAHNIIATDVNNFIVPPMARLRLTSNVSFTNSTHGTVGFKNTNATEDYDTDAMINLSGSNSAITINTAGIYLCTASMNYAASAVGSRFTRIVRDRSSSLTAVCANMMVPTGNDTHIAIAGMIECAANDVIDLYGFQSSGGALNVQPTDGSGIQYGGTWLSVLWVGRTS